MPNTLAIDFGSRYIGIALVNHPEPGCNRVLYAVTLIVEPKPLNALVDTRAGVRRLRRTRKTHGRRLSRLAQALQGIASADQVLRFCCRRGYSHEEQEVSEPGTQSFHVPRYAFFAALRQEVARLVAPEDQARVMAACSKHLNEDCRRTAELRPARFDNRRPSRCNWEGCTRQVPRAGNDTRGPLRQALFAWLLPVLGESKDRDRLGRSVDYWIGQLEGLARAYRGAADDSARKPVTAQIQRIYRTLLTRVGGEASTETAAKFTEAWGKHYRKAVWAILKGERGGRVRYCRRHSDEFVNHFRAGKPIPNREDITEADLVSRKQQILFRRLWRLVEARLLPLAGGRIDRVIVERVAFDILAGPLKVRQELSPEKAAEMYWHGPQFGFADRAQMLQKEFGGRCAYCGVQGASDQVEHLLPRSAFPFDSYFNVLPACAACNARKGARTPLEAGMVLHEDAYEAYAEYVRGRKPPHVYQTIKKGLLNLLRRPASAGEAERRLAMLANDLVRVTATQRSPRPLARYLATKLQEQTGHRPKVGYCAGRHTALYRSALLPDYDKGEMQEEADLRNHAVDAVVLGCELPSAAALENTKWNTRPADIRAWFDAVKEAGPETVESLGLPRVEPVQFVPNFEEDLGGGYCAIKLSAFNWNHLRKATHMLDPFGQTANGIPLKREPAAAVLDALKNTQKCQKQIAMIAHRGLRQLLEGAEPGSAPVCFVRWLQDTIRAGQGQSQEGNHPADLARRELLRRFVQAQPGQVVAGVEPIPATVGVRCLNKGSENKLHVTRVSRHGEVFQRYQAQPVFREWYVGYRLTDGQLDRGKPVVFTVTQGYAVRTKRGGIPRDISSASPLRGRPHGAGEPVKEFLARWQQEFDSLCQQEGIVKRFRIRQGCVVEKTDGTRFQFRNFDRSEPWMKAEALRDIRRVHRSPLGTT